MNIAPKLTCTVLAAACLFGLSGLASVANAAEPTSGTVVTANHDGSGADAAGADVNINASRHFDVSNTSSHTFVVQKVFFATGDRTSGKLPEDSYPAVGTTLQPGQSLGFEVQAYSDHNVNVILSDTSGSGAVVVYMHVSGGTCYPSASNMATTGPQFQFTPQPSIGLLTISDPS